jgi:putative ABC transport system permease protein
VLAGLNERRREIAVLRAVGASARGVFTLLMTEGLFITLLGCAAGVALLLGLTVLAAPLAQSHYGIAVHPRVLSLAELRLLGLVVLVGVAASVVPGYRAYRLSLADGLTPRL